MKTTLGSGLVPALLFGACAAPAAPVAPETTHSPPPPPIDAAHGVRRNVAVIVYEGVELLDFAGPLEVFTCSRGWDEAFRVYTVGPTTAPVRTGNQVVVVPDHGVGDCPAPDVIVIPGGETVSLTASRPIGRWLLQQEPRAEIVFSVCNGAFCLAEAGLLDGLEATTHHSMLGWLRQAA